jgi:hypothetical protein
MKFTESLFPLSVVVCASLGGGCILTTNGEDDGNQDGESDGDDDSLDDPSIADDDDGSGESPTEADGTDGTDDSDDGTTGPSGECSANLVMDPGFEAGAQGTAWDQASTTFGTPICNADCTDDANAGPFEGEYWAWFGGLEEMEAASLTQSITIPAAENALLSFRFAINATTGTGDDEFRVTVDGTEEFMVTDAEMDAYADYTHVDVDLTAYADGAAHTIRFESDHPGHPDTGLITNFFLDKVSLVTCSASGTDSGDSGSSDGSTAADDTSTGTDSGSTDAGSSDSGDSSSSSTTM